MFERNLIPKNAVTAVLATLCAIGLSSCSSGVNNGTAQVTPQGTVDLANLKAGIPENVFKDAIISFAVDSKPQASANGKTQYISRQFAKDGGQYVAQCKDGKCFGLEMHYQPQNPVDKAQAMEDLKQILPADAPAETKVSDADMKAGKKNNEFHYYGDVCTGVVLYTDNSGAKVQQISVFMLPGEDVEAAFAGKPLKAKKALAEKKATDTGAPAATDEKSGKDSAAAQ